MIASNAATISSKFATACGFSIFAMTGIRTPAESIIWCTRFISAASRTNESAIKSAPIPIAHFKSSSSFSESAGTDTAAPGKFKPLLLLTVPPSMTIVSILGAFTEVTSKATRPSSINIRSPTLQSPGNPKYVVEEIFSSPSITSVVIVNFAPLIIS